MQGIQGINLNFLAFFYLIFLINSAISTAKKIFFHFLKYYFTLINSITFLSLL